MSTYHPNLPPDTWIVLPSGTNAFDASIRQGALEYAREHDFCRIRLADEDTLRIMLHTTTVFKDRSIALIAHIRDAELLNAVRHHRLHAILLGEENVPLWRKRLGGACTVCSIDNEAIGILAANYLSELRRFRSYVYADGLANVVWKWWCDRRFEGFSQTLTSLELPAPYRCSFMNRMPTDDVREFAALVKSIPGPVAVFACNDQIAREVMTACTTANLSVPADVAILGVDDDAALCGTSPITISSIRADQVRLGRIAMALLMRQIEGCDDRNRTILCPPLRIVERMSTRPIHSSNEAVERASKFIAQGKPRSITLEQVVTASGRSRSYLLKHFKQVTGQTVLKAIQNHTLEIVRAQLLDTNLPNTAIARQNGFSSLAVLCALFRRRYGITMSVYRRKHQFATTPTTEADESDAADSD